MVFDSPPSPPAQVGIIPTWAFSLLALTPILILVANLLGNTTRPGKSRPVSREESAAGVVRACADARFFPNLHRCTSNSPPVSILTPKRTNGYERVTPYHTPSRHCVVV